MPTQAQRIRTLVAIGFLPEASQNIVRVSDKVEINDAFLRDLAAITDNDIARAQAFFLFSPVVPDVLRTLLSANVIGITE